MEEFKSSKEFPDGTKKSEEATVPSRPAAIRNPYAIGRTTASVRACTSINGSSSNNINITVSKSISGSKIASKLASDEKEAASLANNSKAIQQQQQQNELAYWERLPSRNVSFKPAEILTVQECLQCSKLYCEENQSVRITGILEHRFVRSDDRIELQLKDPKSTSTAAIAEKARRKSGSFSRKSLSGTKRPWFASTTTTKTPSKQAPQETLTTMLRVIVDPSTDCLPLAVAGSCLTIVGEFLDASSVSARTLAVVPTTNMVLYEQALRLRRKTMYERYYYNNNSSSQKMLLQGCGPPPYEKFNRGEKQRRV